MKLLAVALLLASTFAACTLLQDDPPENTCESDFECFSNVEQCNLDAGMCELKPDAGP